MFKPVLDSNKIECHLLRQVFPDHAFTLKEYLAKFHPHTIRQINLMEREYIDKILKFKKSNGFRTSKMPNCENRVMGEEKRRKLNLADCEGNKRSVEEDGITAENSTTSLNLNLHTTYSFLK